MAVGCCSASASAADQVAQLLAELDVFDQETARLSRDWEANAMLPHGSIRGEKFHVQSDSANGHVWPQSWNTWQGPGETCYRDPVRIEWQGVYGVPLSERSAGERNQQKWADQRVSWDSGSAPRPGGSERWAEERHPYRETAPGEYLGASVEGLAKQSEGQDFVGAKLMVVSEDGLVNSSDGRRDREEVRGQNSAVGGNPKADGCDGVEKGEALVRPRKAAFTFAKTPRFSKNEVAAASADSVGTGDRTAPPDVNPKPNPAQTLNPKPAPPFAKAPPRRTIIDEMVTQSLPTKDLVYEPEYKLVHKRVPGASFGKPVGGRGKKRRGCGTDSNDGDRRSVLDSLCRNWGADADCAFGDKCLACSEENEGSGEEKSTLGPGFYDVDLKSVQKRVPAVGFATNVSREEPGRARRTEEGQLLTLDLTRALGAVSKRIKGVVGFGSGPPRFVEEDDKENQTKRELKPNYRVLEPRVKGALPYRKPAGADRPKPLSPENSQLLTSRSATSSLGTASPVDTPRGVLPSPDPTPLFPRHPAWKFSPPPQQGALAKPQNRPLQRLTPSETLVRPRTDGALEFGRVTGRGEKEESVTVRLRRAKQPGPGQYALAQAWR